jgi:hypothetical protein
VLPDRIELSASPLPMGCSTTELRQHLLRGWYARRDGGSTAIGSGSTQGKKTPITAFNINTNPTRPMSKSQEATVRDQRLAAKLRENLKRRKGQAKARSDSERQAPDPQPAPETVTVKKP